MWILGRSTNLRSYTMIRQLTSTIALAFAAVLTSTLAHSADYPNRVIQVIVPFAAGSGSDVIARIVFERMGTSMGQQFIVNNRPGAGGDIGTLAIARAAPDGYNLLFGAQGPLAVNPIWEHNLGYDPGQDFAPISRIVEITNVFAVSSKLPVTSVSEFLAYAKSSPDPINYSSVGIGSSQHLGGAYFAYVEGIKMTHVPYRSGPQLVGDLISGVVPVSFSLPSNVLGEIRDGKIRALAVTGPKRLTILPNVPTIAEAGVSNYDSRVWFALLAPRGTPRAIIDKLNKELRTALLDPTVRNRLATFGAEPSATSPEELSRFISSETVKWRDIITRAAITIEAR